MKPWFAAVLTWCLAGSASAERLLVIPAFVEEGPDPAAVQEHIRRWAGAHYDDAVLPASAVRQELEPCLHPRQTRPPGCAEKYLSASDADWAVAAWVEPDVAWVAIMMDRSIAYLAHERGQTWPEALTKALRAARRRQQRGFGPWLEVTGFPDGAVVLVDGKPQGHVGGTAIRVAAGSHELEIRSRGYNPQVTTAFVPRAADHAEIGVSLQPAKRLPAKERLAAAPPRETAPSPRTVERIAIALGAVTLAIGAPLTVAAASARLRSGDCRAAGCDSGGIPDGRSGAATAALITGGTLTAAGAAGVAWGIVRLRLHVEPERALITWGGRF